MTGNKSSRLCWAYQTAVDAEGINAVDDVTYYLGKFSKECDKWTLPFINMPVDKYWNYGSRTPSLTPKKPLYPTFKISSHPITAQYEAWQLKQVTEDGIGANVHSFTSLETGLPLPITFRHELNEGSVDRLVQAVNSYQVGLYCRAMLGFPFLAQQEFAFGRLEDYRGEWKADDTVASVDGDTITLTDEPQRAVDYYNGWLVFVSGGDNEDTTFTVDDSDDSDPPVLTLDSTPNANLAADTIKLFDKERPKLTTSPVLPGESAADPYDGTPQVHWDVEDENIALTEAWMAEWTQRQNYATCPDANSKYQSVYLYNHEPVELILNAVLERHKVWSDYLDREARQINVKIYKPNTSYYVLHKFSNCYVITAQETGERNKGHYNCRIVLQAEKVEGEFTIESETNWSTHYKHVT